MTKEKVAKKYLSFLEKGEVDSIVDLFTENGIVESPLYGTQLAKDFYKILADDTGSSKLKFDGLFFENDSNRISLLFEYHWKLKNGKDVQFKVVDIIELDDKNKILKLTIIYDTVRSREIVNDLREKTIRS